MWNLSGNVRFRRRRIQATVLAVGVCAILAGTAMGKPEAPAITGATQKLFEAIASNNLGAAQAALAAGADLMVRNRAGQTPIEAANQRARYEIAHFLLLEKNGRRTGIAKAEAAKPAPVPAARVIAPAEPAKLAGPFDPTRGPVATLPLIGTIREPIMVAAAPSTTTAAAPTRDAINARPSTEAPSKNWFSKFLDTLWSSGGSSGITMVVSAPDSPNADMVPPRESTASWTHASPTPAAPEPKSTGSLALLFGFFSSSNDETPAPVTEIAALSPPPSSTAAPKLASAKPAVQPLVAHPGAPVKLAQGQAPSIPSVRAANDVAALAGPSAAPAPVVGPTIVAVRKEPDTTLTTITPAAPVSTSAEAEATIAEGQGLWARIINLFATPTPTAPAEIPAPQIPMVASIGNYDRVTGTLAATPITTPLETLSELPAAVPPAPAAHALTPRAQPAVIDRLVAGIGEFGRVFERLDATEQATTVAAADAPAHTSVNPPASTAVIDRLVAWIGEFGRVFGRLDATVQPAPVVVAQDPAPTYLRSVQPTPSASVATPRIALIAQNGLARMSDVSVFDRFFGWLEATPQPVVAEAPVERLPIATRTPPSAPVKAPVARREPSRTTLAPVMAGAKDKDAPLELANLPPATDTDVPTMSTAGPIPSWASP